MIKLVIFDLDGTLVDAYRAVAASVNYTLKKLDLKPRSFATIKRSVGHGDRQLMEKFAGLRLAEEAIAIYRAHHAKVLMAPGAVTLMPGSLAVLKFLEGQGYKIAVASNRPTKFTRIILKERGILKYFDMVLCADRAPKPKPYPDMLWAIAKRFKILKTEALYVGDMTIDINCGRGAGIKVVAVATGSSSRKELNELKPWAIIGRINQLKAIMEGL